MHKNWGLEGCRTLYVGTQYAKRQPKEAKSYRCCKGHTYLDEYVLQNKTIETAMQALANAHRIAACMYHNECNTLLFCIYVLQATCKPLYTVEGGGGGQSPWRGGGAEG